MRPSQDLSWMDDPALLVRQRGAAIWPRKTKIFALLCLVFAVIGAAAAAWPN